MTTRHNEAKLKGIASPILYSRAPIREVIFDVHVVGGVGSAWDLADGFAEIKQDYPRRREIIGSSGFELTFDLSGQPTLEAEPSLVGLRYFSTDAVRQFEARLDGFSFNHVSQQPGDYKGWQEFEREVKPLLDIYFRHRKPTGITRLGLRYINQFDLSETPDETVTLSDFFRFHPLWDQSALGDANGFQVKMAFHGENESRLLISQETAPQEIGETVLLDIDAFFEDLQLPAQDTDEIWRRAQQLRVLKNRAFNACLTPQTKDSIL